MCLHASWMKTEHCTRCTPLPKLHLVEGFRTGKNDRGSDEILVDVDLIDRLCEQSDKPAELRSLLCAPELPEYRDKNDPGCIFYRPRGGNTWERAIGVELVSGKQSLATASRAAFVSAAANQGKHLVAGQHAVHLCGAENHDGEVRLCCINPAHIVRR